MQSVGFARARIQAPRLIALLFAVQCAAPLAGLLIAPARVFAADAPVLALDPVVEQRNALEAARMVMVRGPATLHFSDQATMLMPANFVFIPAKEARRVLLSLGNAVGEGFEGIVVPITQDSTFSFFDIQYQGAGYVRDDDARNWDPAELLDRVRLGTEEGNERRRAMGIQEIESTDWIQAPQYDATTHQLVWSFGVRVKGAGPRRAQGINYRTLVLGREGYLAMTLVTDDAHLDALRPAVTSLLAGLSFDFGKRYADFESGKDRVAAIGLATLVAGMGEQQRSWGAQTLRVLKTPWPYGAFGALALVVVLALRIRSGRARHALPESSPGGVS
jgi:uncharacterized membrane-anchored protein